MSGVTNKSPVMYGLILALWVGTVAVAWPFFTDLVSYSSSPVVTGLFGIIAVSLCVFWLFGYYNIVVTAFGYLVSDSPDRVPYEQFADEPVAIAYPTFNDFSADHLAASMQQSHDRVHTYIVDDSTDESVVAEIDAFAAERDDVTIVRRPGREGYKAGALNYALEHVIDEEYFVIMDADEILDPEFITKTFTYFAADDIGFVQGNHDYNRSTATRFGDALGIGVDIHWDVYQPPKNRFGFVMLLGHGALVRRDVWADIGGFPELVSEDLAFCTRSREHGYRGVFAADVECLEDFPVDYEAFMQRHRKWTAGSIEYIREELPRYLRSNASVTEKLDVAIPAFQLPLTVLFVGYIFTVGALMALTDTVIPDAVVIPEMLGLVTVVTLAAPVYCYMVGLARRPRKLAHFVATSTTVYCSVAVASVTHGLKTLLPWEAAEFLTTPKTESGSVSYRKYVPTVVTGLLAVGIASQGGLLVGAAALTWVLAPFIAKYNAQSLGGRFARVSALVPVLLMAASMMYGVYVMASA